jgi:uncharacterized membrane protein YhaH (DUF805 family)
MTDSQPLESAESGQNTRIGYRIFFVIAWAMVMVVVLNIALAFSHRSAAYEWTNRLGVFMALVFTLAFLVWGLANTARRRWDGTRANAWAFRVSALIVSSLFLFMIWDRILDALWLR